MEKRIRPLHIALIVAQISRNNIINGRTRIHKLVYLEQLKSKRKDVSFRPYYYGPYSDDLAIGLSEAVALGLLEERIERTLGQGEIFNYKYELTDQGKKFYKEIVSEKPEAKKVQEYLGMIQNVTENLSATQVSYMAKALYVLKTEDKKRVWTLSEIINDAKKFKWEISPKELRSLMSKLVDLKLVSEK